MELSAARRFSMPFAIMPAMVRFQNVLGFDGNIVYDTDNKMGYRKLMDCSRIHATGWIAKTKFWQGLAKAYADLTRSFAGSRGQMAPLSSPLKA